MPTIDDLKSGLARLQALDTEFSVFGARSHCYESFPLDESQLLGFEKEIGVELPGEYRQFLLEVGWGVGPEYGLLSPEEIWNDSDPWKTFPITSADFPEIERHFAAGTAWNMGNISWPGEGFLIFSLQGCGGFSALVTFGEFRGTVWGGDITLRPSLYPARKRWFSKHAELKNDGFDRPDQGFPMTFFEWYTDWLQSNTEKLLQKMS